MNIRHAVVALITAVLLAGCGQTAAPPAASTTPGGKPWRIVLVSFTEGPLYSAGHVAALKDLLQEKGYQEGRDFALQVRSAQNDMTMVPLLIDAAVTDRADLLVTFQSPVLYTAMQRAPEINKVFAIIADPFALGAGTSDTEHAAHVTGCYTALAIDELLDGLVACRPTAKRIGTLTITGNAESEALVRTYAAACRRKGLELVTRGYVTSSEAGEAAKALCAERLDAVLPLPDAQSMMTGPLLSQTAAAATLPLLALWPGADIRPSMYLKSPGNGMQTIMRRFAEMAVRVLEGTDPATMPFVNVANPVRRLTVVPEAAAAVGLSVPERLRATVS